MALDESKTKACEERRAVRRLIDLSQEDSREGEEWKDWEQTGPHPNRQTQASLPTCKQHLRSLSARRNRVHVSDPQCKAQSCTFLSILDGRVPIGTVRVPRSTPLPAFLVNTPEPKLLFSRKGRKTAQQASYVPYSLLKQCQEKGKTAFRVLKTTFPGLYEGKIGFLMSQRKAEDKENKGIEGLQVKTRLSRKPHSIAM